jgi:DHA1 family inner membrane transport protein
MLILYGVGLTVGNWLGGRFADRSIDGTLLTTLGGLVVLLVLFAGVMRWPAPAAVLIFFWGVASFAIVPPLQLRVMTHAAEAPNLASAMNIGAFNLGNAIGAALGGAVIDLGLGYPMVSIAGAGMAAAGLVMVLAMRGSSHAAPRREGPLRNDPAVAESCQA